MNVWKEKPCDNGIGVIKVVGPSKSGKTTVILKLTVWTKSKICLMT